MLACRIQGGAMLAPSLLQELWTNQRSVAARGTSFKNGVFGLAIYQYFSGR